MKKQLALLCLIACLAGQAQNLTDKDQKFAKNAAEAGVKEVKLGELAQRNGSATEVKTLGQHMIDDHTKAGANLTAIAAKKGMSLPTMMNMKDQKTYDKLAKMQGKDFDKAYTKCMVKDHKKVIGMFKKEADKGDDQDLKSFSQSTLPTLEHHKQMSIDACKAVKR